MKYFTTLNPTQAVIMLFAMSDDQFVQIISEQTSGILISTAMIQSLEQKTQFLSIINKANAIPIQKSSFDLHIAKVVKHNPHLTGLLSLLNLNCTFQL